MRKFFTLLLFLVSSIVLNAQETLKDYILNNNEKNTLKYEWIGQSKEPTGMYTTKIISLNGNTLLIKEISEFQNKIASETYYTCVLTDNTLKTKSIISNSILGNSERIVEQILLKLPKGNEVLKWSFVDERDGTKFNYSVKKAIINNKKALLLTQKIEGENGSVTDTYIKGIGLYEKNVIDDKGVKTKLFSLVEE